MATSFRTVVVLLVVVTLFSSTSTQTHAAPADSSLVIAALDVLKRDYPKPIKTVDLLNAAIAELRQATNLGPEKIPDLQAGLEDSQAVSAFRQEFAEIVTVSVQDEHRGTVVGEKPEGVLGAGRSVSLPAGGMYVRTHEVAGPKNEQIDRVGITPDVAVPLTESDMERGQDPQLDAARKAVRSG